LFRIAEGIMERTYFAVLSTTQTLPNGEIRPRQRVVEPRVSNKNIPFVQFETNKKSSNTLHIYVVP
jgi:hypothetical protein